MNAQVFWSYRRADDDQDGNRISKFARAVEAEYEMLTGNQLTFFLDQDSLTWGDDWNERIANAVNDAVFFVPVLTPRYFRSEPCRDEFRAFVSKARQIGITERILSLIYVNISDLDRESTDELKSWTATYHHEMIQELRWLSTESDEFRRLANTIAEKIISLEATLPPAVNSDIDQRLPVDPIDRAPALTDDEQGYVEIVATAEEAMPVVVEAIKKCLSSMTALYAVADRYISPLNNAPTASAKLAILREFAHDVAKIDESFGPATEQFVANLSAVDTGVQAILAWPIEFLSDEDVKAREQLVKILKTFRANWSEAHQKLGELRQVITTLLPLSNAIRGPLNKIDTSLLRFTDALAIIQRWNLGD